MTHPAEAKNEEISEFRFIFKTAKSCPRSLISPKDTAFRLWLDFCKYWVSNYYPLVYTSAFRSGAA